MRVKRVSAVACLWLFTNVVAVFVCVAEKELWNVYEPVIEACVSIHYRAFAVCVIELSLL